MGRGCNTYSLGLLGTKFTAIGAIYQKIGRGCNFATQINDVYENTHNRNRVIKRNQIRKKGFLLVN